MNDNVLPGLATAGTAQLPEVDGSTTIDQLRRALGLEERPLDELFAEAASLAFKKGLPPGQRRRRDGLEFICPVGRATAALVYTKEDPVGWHLDAERMRDVVQASNRVLELLHDVALSYDIPIFALLGLRNLSSFVGEVFARELFTLHRDRFMQNPNQDGYPDLCALTPEGVRYVDQITECGRLSEKSLWSPFPYGGLEVKATCGNTPKASSIAKPKIGESRFPILKDAEWKAHHRETNNLLGIFWDFIDGLPTVLAAFFRNDLTVDDWGSIVAPREGGGRTTSVSLMKKGRRNEDLGVGKMGKGWLVLPKDEEIQAVLRRVFYIPSNDAQ